jgi:hypothetical protein
MSLFAPSNTNSAVSESSADCPAAVRPCHAIVGRLRGVNGNSLGARRLRELAAQLADDLGGVDRLSEPVKIQIRQAAALTVEAEQMQARIARGEAINHEDMVRIANSLSRMLQRLGLKRPAPPKAKTPLAAYLASKREGAIP